MGWSLSVHASNTLEIIGKYCVKTTGVQNMYVVDGDTYFYEVERKEFEDGSVIGQVYRLVEDESAFLVGSFKIEANGYITKWFQRPVSWRSYQDYFKELKGFLFYEENGRVIADMGEDADAWWWHDAIKPFVQPVRYSVKNTFIQ